MASACNTLGPQNRHRLVVIREKEKKIDVASMKQIFLLTTCTLYALFLCGEVKAKEAVEGKSALAFPCSTFCGPGRPCTPPCRQHCGCSGGGSQPSMSNRRKPRSPSPSPPSGDCSICRLQKARYPDGDQWRKCF